MEVGPAQACAVKVVVHERRRVEVKAPFTIGAPVDSDGKRSPYEYGVNAASRYSLFLSEEKSPEGAPKNEDDLEKREYASRSSLVLL